MSYNPASYFKGVYIMAQYEMITIRQLAATGLMPESALRLLVRQNEIPFRKVGNRVYLNYEAVKEALKKFEEHHK